MARDRWQIYRIIKKTLKNTFRWMADHEEGIFAVMFMALFLANTYCAIRTYINPEWDTESVTYYTATALLDLLISILYLRIEHDKAEIGLLRKILDRQHRVINELFNNRQWKK